MYTVRYYCTEIHVFNGSSTEPMHFFYFLPPTIIGSHVSIHLLENSLDDFAPVSLGGFHCGGRQDPAGVQAVCAGAQGEGVHQVHLGYPEVVQEVRGDLVNLDNDAEVVGGPRGMTLANPSQGNRNGARYQKFLGK